MEMTYDYACSLTKGHFIPPGFHPVSSCNFYGFLHYFDPSWPLTYVTASQPTFSFSLGRVGPSWTLSCMPTTCWMHAEVFERHWRHVQTVV